MARYALNARCMAMSKLTVQRRALTLKETKEIDQLTLEATEGKEEEDEEKTILALDVRELLIL